MIFPDVCRDLVSAFESNRPRPSSCDPLRVKMGQRAKCAGTDNPIYQKTLTDDALNAELIEVSLHRADRWPCLPYCLILIAGSIDCISEVTDRVSYSSAVPPLSDVVWQTMTRFFRRPPSGRSARNSPIPLRMPYPQLQSCAHAWTLDVDLAAMEAELAAGAAPTVAAARSRAAMARPAGFLGILLHHG